jgi:hypothetical protein
MSAPHAVSTIPSNLMYFEALPQVNVYEGSHIEYLNPISGTDGAQPGSPLKFVITGTENFVDLAKTYLILRCKLNGKATVKENGSDVDKSVKLSDLAATKLTPVNILPHALFKQIRIKLGNQNITGGDTDYAYKAYLQLLFNTNQDAQDTYFKLCGWEKDPADMHDNVDLNTATVKQMANESANKRRKLMSDDGEAEYVMKIHSALFFHDKAIPPYLDIEIEMLRHPTSAFHLMHIAGANFSVEITKAYLQVQKLHVVPEYVAGIEEMLRKNNENITFPLNDAYVGNYVINQGVYNYHNDTLFLGRIPKRIIIGFVEGVAYNGSCIHNPFNFQDFNIEYVRLTKNGLDYPHPPLIIDWDKDHYKQAYHYLCSSVQGDYNDAVLHITPQEFKQGYTLFSYDMSPDQRGSVDLHNAANKPSQIKFEVRFKTPTAHPIQMIVYFETDTIISFDYKRNVMVTHL